MHASVVVGALHQDVRYAVRHLRRAPAFTAVAISCLAVGIGVNTAAFGAIAAIALRPVPGVADAPTLRSLHLAHRAESATVPDPVTLGEYRELRERVAGVATLTASTTTGVSFRDAATGDVHTASAELVADDYFAVLGSRPALGRFFAVDERGRAPSPVAVVSHAFWAARLGGRPDALGTRIVVNGQPLTVVGVAAAGFHGARAPDVLRGRGPSGPDVWVPAAMLPALLPNVATRTESTVVRVVARVRPGLTDAQRDARLAAAARALAERLPRDRAATTIRVTALGRGPNDTNATLLAAFGLALAVPLVVLATACANLASLQLARAAQRSGEVATRIALGASRGRLLRQLLTESALLAAFGGVGALLLTLGMPHVLRIAGVALPAGGVVDGRLLAFTTGAVLLATVGVGLAPAWRATRPELVTALKDESPAGATRPRLRRALVVGQVAASVVLLVTCVLLLAGVRARRRAALGFAERGVAMTVLDFDAAGYGAARAAAIEQRVLERVGGLPGVAAAGAASLVPLESAPDERASAGGVGDAGVGRAAWVKRVAVAGDFFRASGMDVRDGAVAPGSDGVAVTQTLARSLWPGVRAVGRTLRLGDGRDARAWTVAAVVGDVRMRVDGDVEPTVFVPGRSVGGRVAVYARGTADNAAALRDAMRRAVQDADPTLPPPTITTSDTLLDAAMRPMRSTAVGVGALAGVAFALALAGVYAIVSYLVSARRREFGVRYALGASRADVMRLVLGDAGRLAGTGVAIGVALAAGVGAALGRVMNGASPFTPLPFLAVAATLLGATVLAAWVPARRAAAVDAAALLRRS